MSDKLIMQLQDEITQLRRDIYWQEQEIERLREKLQAARRRITELMLMKGASNEAGTGNDTQNSGG